MNIQRAMAFIAVAFLTGCGSHPGSSTTPTPAPTPVPPPPPVYQILNGYAYDTAFRSIEGATITVVDGAQAGASTTSNESGHFTFAGTFAAGTKVRASKEGYSTATQTAQSNSPSSGTVWVFVVLDALARPVDVVGDYTLTIVADSACAGIPGDARTRTWPASIGIRSGSNTQPGTALTLVVNGGSFLPDRNSFSVGVSGSDIAFAVWAGEDFGLIEKVAPATFLAIGGNSKASIGMGPITTIAMPFFGTIDYCALQSDTGWTHECNSGPRTAFEHCESAQHQLILSRR